MRNRVRPLCDNRFVNPGEIVLVCEYRVSPTIQKSLALTAATHRATFFVLISSRSRR